MLTMITLGTIRRLMVSALIGCCICAAYAQPSLVGTPPVVRHAADVGNPQNFAVVQDSAGIVYLGNGAGVLEFDGERWRLIQLANRDAVRSLAIDSQDRVYVGGYNAFGYLRRDAAGKAQIVELTERFASLLGDREFNDIWRVAVTPEGIYFSALRDLFFWDPKTDETAYWQHAGRFGALIHHQGQTILQFRGEGFRRRVGSQWVPMEYTSDLKTLITDLLPLADGSLLAPGIDGRWMRIDGDRTSRASMPAELPAANNFQAAMSLADGALILGGADGQIYVVDPSLTAVHRFALDSGFLSGLTAANGGFLASADEAFYRVGWPSAWSVLGAEHGLGDLMSMGQWNGTNYLLSSAGVLRLQPQVGSTPGVFIEPWGERLFTAMYPVDANRALLGTSHKLLIVNDGEVRELVPELIYPRNFAASKFYPGRIYIGTENGLRYVELHGDQLSISPPASQGLEILTFSPHEESPLALWYGSARHGLWKAELNTAGEIIGQQRYGAEHGLQMGVIAGAEIAAIDSGPMIVSTRMGLFRWDGEGFVAESLHGLAELHLPEELLTVFSDDAGNLWAYSAYRVLRHSAAHGWQLQPIDQLRRGAVHQYHLGTQGRVEFLATRSLLIYAGESGGTAAYAPKVQLRAISMRWNDGRTKELPLNPAEPVEIEFGDYGIQFDFALPDLAFQAGASYRGRLLGYESEFSQWRTSRGYLYSRMSPGVYTMEVEARDGGGQVSAIAPYTLVILAPWYRTWWMITIGVILALALLAWLVLRATRSRTRRLAEEKRQLEATVAIRTRDLASANQRLQMIAHIDGLTGIANRRRLDEYLAKAWSQCRDIGQSLGLLAIDVDHFKRYNDTHGHLAGDQFLKALVPILDRCLRRPEDLLARYGGEEFLAIMPGVDTEIASHVAEAMRAEVEAAELGATISIGVASAIPNGDDPKRLLASADAALYQAKGGGRNRVEVVGGAGSNKAKH